MHGTQAKSIAAAIAMIAIRSFWALIIKFVV
jgi:hypothetical protein